MNNQRTSWFSGDLHFFHKQIIRHCNRPFSSVEEMNDALVNNWNSRITSNSDVYFLGDFCLAGDDKVSSMLKRLNGRIHFIEGNHDKFSKSIRSRFVWYDKAREITVEGQRLFLSHYAHRTWPRKNRGSYMLYAHSHNTLPDDPNLLSIDCGVDAHNYFPISFGQVKEIMSKKSVKF